MRRPCGLRPRRSSGPGVLAGPAGPAGPARALGGVRRAVKLGDLPQERCQGVPSPAPVGVAPHPPPPAPPAPRGRPLPGERLSVLREDD